MGQRVRDEKIGGIMNYPIAIEIGDDTHAVGVVVPDLPGCFSAGDTVDEAVKNAEKAITAWIDTMLDAGESIPRASSLADLVHANPDYSGWVWAIVTIDPSVLDDRVERINITLPRRV